MSSEGGGVPPAVECVGLGKAYRLYDRPHHRLLELLGLRRAREDESFWAVRGVDLTVARGECVAIVGRNGAGKSTLLEMIAGTTRPDTGAVAVRGRVAALLALGSGFNPELTGRENVQLNAAVLGLTSAEVRDRYDAIVEFSGLGEHIDRPVRTYSTGMSARLAFSVAAHVDADVLIVDETLAVGDGMFVQKCMRWIRAFRQRGTLLFVSHATDLVTELCDRAVWLEEGRKIADGVAKEVVRAYAEATHRAATGDARISSGRGLRGGSDGGAKAEPHAPFEADRRRADLDRLGLRPVLEGLRFDADAAWWGRGGARIESVRLLNASGRAARAIETGEAVTIEMDCVAEERLEHPVVGYVVRNRRGQVLFSDNSWIAFGSDGPGPIEAGRRFVARFRVQFPHLPAGEFALGGAIADGRPRAFIQHHRVDDAVLFRVPTSHLVEGLVGAPMLGCEILDVSAAEPKDVAASRKENA